MLTYLNSLALPDTENCCALKQRVLPVDIYHPLPLYLSLSQRLYPLHALL